MTEQEKNNPVTQKSNEDIRALKTIFYPVLGVFVFMFFF